MELIHQPARQTTQTRFAVILLHGFGSNEEDLMGLAPMLPPTLEIFSLRAPFTLAYAWYHLDWSSGRPNADRQEIADTEAELHARLDALRNITLPKNLADAVEAFDAYVDEEGLLPDWQYRLDVVKCAGIVDEPIEGQVYLFPATGGHYNHKRSKSFGLYKGKQVGYVALIEAVVDLHGDDDHQILWKNIAITVKELVEQSRGKLARWQPGNFPTRVFLLGEIVATSFRKDTPKGMQGSKQYFWVNAKDAQDLAGQLADRGWSEWRAS